MEVLRVQGLKEILGVPSKSYEALSCSLSLSILQSGCQFMCGLELSRMHRKRLEDGRVAVTADVNRVLAAPCQSLHLRGACVHSCFADLTATPPFGNLAI